MQNVKVSLLTMHCLMLRNVISAQLCPQSSLIGLGKNIGSMFVIILIHTMLKLISLREDVGNRSVYAARDLGTFPARHWLEH